ncbi:MAG: tRNA lysidine(34) synthetase TilS [Polyangiaceae bacterium]
MTRARGSHAPSLLTLVRRALSECEIGAGSIVLVACSGGPDSTALLHALTLLRERARFEVRAHGVDHGLRPEAAAELDLVERFAAELGVPFGRSRLAVAPGGNLQERARLARIDALRAAARRVGATTIATGHTADDRAETLLMRLVRGTGPRGLAVLPPRAGDLARPLLRATRADVLLHVQRHGLVTSMDPSNENPRFLRVRVRREVMPLLSSLSPRAVQAICALADDMLALELPPSPDAGMTRRQRAARAKVEPAKPG